MMVLYILLRLSRCYNYILFSIYCLRFYFQGETNLSNFEGFSAQINRALHFLNNFPDSMQAMHWSTRFNIEDRPGTISYKHGKDEIKEVDKLNAEKLVCIKAFVCFN